MAGQGSATSSAGLIAEEIGRNLSADAVAVDGACSPSRRCCAAATARRRKRCCRRSPAATSLRRAGVGREATATRRTASRRALPAAAARFKLNGERCIVLDGHVADRLIVTARTAGDVASRDGITLFLIDAKASGVNIDAHADWSIATTPRASAASTCGVSESDVIGTFDKRRGRCSTRVLDVGRAVARRGVARRRARRRSSARSATCKSASSSARRSARSRRCSTAPRICSARSSSCARSCCAGAAGARRGAEPTRRSSCALAKARAERRGDARGQRSSADARRHRHDRRVRHRLLHEARARRRRDFRRLRLSTPIASRSSRATEFPANARLALSAAANCI